ncbi:hypothetical protein RclHR1_00030023 [Rhizophagus clarus]|uniref:Uncharacterized protein n=1 Tax=Rhizophagus clarus TaxID=94130 RepID=A0A2Z6RZB4_9GLOM|nr:hypothetical protein RclHR1_00030023 [Rhizophagus clarus]
MDVTLRLSFTYGTFGFSYSPFNELADRRFLTSIKSDPFWKTRLKFKIIVRSTRVTQSLTRVLEQNYRQSQLNTQKIHPYNENFEYMPNIRGLIGSILAFRIDYGI